MRYFILGISLILLASCRRATPVVQTDAITKITLARSGAWSFYGDALTIDSSLTVKYFGTLYKGKRAYYTGKVSRNFWDSLNTRFEQIKYKTLPDTTSSYGQDMIGFELIIYCGKYKKHIKSLDNHKPDPLLSVCKWVGNHLNQVKLIPVNAPIKFETTYQNPPIPKIDHVKFPPPPDTENR